MTVRSGDVFGFGRFAPHIHEKLLSLCVGEGCLKVVSHFPLRKHTKTLRTKVESQTLFNFLNCNISPVAYLFDQHVSPFSDYKDVKL